MKRKSKKYIFWLISLSCIVVGIVLAFVALALSGFNMSRLTMDGPWESRVWTQDAIHITELKIDSRNVDIQVIPTDGDEIEIMYSENQRITFTQSIDDGVMSLAQNRGFSSWFVGFDFSGIFRQEMVVHLPRSVEIVGMFQTTNGRVDVQDLTFERLEISSTNGHIVTADVSVAESLYISTSNGSIDVTSVSADDIELITTNNGVYLHDVYSTGNLDISITQGRMALLNVHVEESITATNSNGAIIFESIYFEQATMRTSNGRVEGTNLRSFEDYQIITSTSHGTTDVNGMRLAGDRHQLGDGDWLLDIRTTNNDIVLTFR